MKPFLSVLISTYKRVKMTLEAIASVGSHPEVEIICVDSGTPQAEYDKLLSGSSQYPVKMYHIEQNLGLTPNWNKCLELSTGTWVGMLNSDDLYKTGAIGRAVKLLHTLDFPCVVVHSRTFDKTVKHPGKDLVRSLRLPSSSGNYWSRSIYEDLGGYDERLIFTPDAEYWYRLAVKYPFVFVPEKYSVYREHDDNASWHTWLDAEAFVREIKLLARLNMVHRGDDVTDYDVVSECEYNAAWASVIYVMKFTITRPERWNIFDAHIPGALRMAITTEQKNIVNQLIYRRNKR